MWSLRPLLLQTARLQTPRVVAAHAHTVAASVSTLLLPSTSTSTSTSIRPLSLCSVLRQTDDRDPKDRTREISLETSLKYMDSAAYAETYGDKKIWELYRRNYAPNGGGLRTRKTCIRHGRITTGNPCPICRDEYLVIDHRNLPLLNQFLTEYNGQLVDREKTGVCRVQWDRLRVALQRALDHGLLPVDPPFVEYDYDKYWPNEAGAQTK